MLAGQASAATPNHGITTKSGNQIANAAAAAMNQATSFTYAGFAGQGGTKTSLRLSVSASGDTQGTVTTNGQTIEIIEVGKTDYVSANKAFWTANGGAAAAQLFGSQWVSGPASSSTFSGFASLLSMSQVTSQFANTSGTSITKGATSTINGQKVIAISTKGGAFEDTLYVATTGTPYIVRVVTAGSSGGTVTFTNYNQPVNAKAPAKSVDLSKLGSTTSTT